MIRFGPGCLVESLAADARCVHCDEPFDQSGGLVMNAEGAPRPIHADCMLRMVVGGVNHLRRTCWCCGGEDAPDPPSLSRREAARVAAVYWRRQRQP